MSDCTKMWADPVLDLQAHDGLLATLGHIDNKIYLIQVNRPERM